MLKTAKQNIKRQPSSVLMIQKGKGMKKNGKGNGKAMKGSKPKPKTKKNLLSKEFASTAMSQVIGRIANPTWKI